jgi:hypothetical protein
MTQVRALFRHSRMTLFVCHLKFCKLVSVCV